jgi:hypothetical protein
MLCLAMIYSLTIRDKSGALLEVNLPEESCLVPTNGAERAVCMKALSDALGLLADTNVTQSISAKEFVTDAIRLQNLQHPADCLVAYHSAPPSKPQENSPRQHLRLVSAD